MYHFVAPPARGGGPAHALRDGQRLGHNDRFLHEYFLRLPYRVAPSIGLIKCERVSPWTPPRSGLSPYLLRRSG